MFSRNVLSSCRRHSTPTWHPFYRSLATETVPSSSPSASSSSTGPPRPPKRLPKPELHTSIILNRSPIITRTPSLFERAYYAYQARIRRALQNPFARDFYFKQGSVVETKFKMEERARERKAFGPSFGLIEDEEDANKESQEAAIAKLNELEQDAGEDALAPRVHPADEARDYKSLDRKGRRNIYLLLLTQGIEGKDVWRFPQGGVEKGELLHQAAQRDLYAECGEHMDTWIVSRTPIGVYRTHTPDATSEGPTPEKVTFFYKAHILQGQVRTEGNGVQDFAWLTKQEIETRVDENYWLAVKDMLSDY